MKASLPNGVLQELEKGLSALSALGWLDMLCRLSGLVALAFQGKDKLSDVSLNCSVCHVAVCYQIAIPL